LNKATAMKKGFIGPDSFFKNISAINSLGCGPNGLESISVKSSDTWRLSRNVVADVHRHLLDNSKDSRFVPKKAALPTDEAVKKILSLTPRNSKEIVQLAMAATLFNSKRPHSLFEAEAGTLQLHPCCVNTNGTLVNRSWTMLPFQAKKNSHTSQWVRTPGRPLFESRDEVDEVLRVEVQCICPNWLLSLGKDDAAESLVNLFVSQDKLVRTQARELFLCVCPFCPFRHMTTLVVARKDPFGAERDGNIAQAFHAAPTQVL